MTNTTTAVEAVGSSSLTFPFQSISGNNLATQTGFNNGEWQFEIQFGSTSKKLIFKDTLSGEARQISNFDFGGYQVCPVTQIKPAIQIPNPAIIEGTAIYDGDAKLVLQKSDFCSQTYWLNSLQSMMLGQRNNLETAVCYYRLAPKYII